ncbi:type III secretion system chaperone family protein [Apibacter adventoris]|uniref:Molecular chaperone Tir n=1 Tax=Apibacter adventoris TaxID=1679466 RepID=A0A2S8A8J6_9FLAO|nr:molecular chaperone Tir [Apibacter adventoris]PQL90806.1 molecular chaperone Tir [Apibacter adventoris]
MYFKKIENFISELGHTISYKDEKQSIFCIENEEDGIKNLIIGIAPPIVVLEQYIFTLHNDDKEILKSLLQKNRDIVHGAFVLDETGKKVIFRYTLQIEHLDINELEGALNSLGLLLSEYYEQILEFSKK